MTSWLTLSLLITAWIAIVDQACAFPAGPVPVMVGPYGSPLMLMRTKRGPEPAYPQRAMMFTGFYRPARRAPGSQASGVFAQGNSVSGGAYLAGKSPDYLKGGPEPADEAEFSSAEAEAAPTPQEAFPVEDGEQSYSAAGHEESEQDQVQTHSNEEPIQYPTEPPVIEEAEIPQTSVTGQPPKAHKPVKKNKKTKVQIENEDDDQDEVEYEEDDEPAAPFVPFKPSRRGNMPNLNNFFPMVFSFPKSLTRSGSSGSSPPGMITAIANSYSTGKGGVASSVATAYGGSPNSKKKRAQSSNAD